MVYIVQQGEHYICYQAFLVLQPLSGILSHLLVFNWFNRIGICNKTQNTLISHKTLPARKLVGRMLLQRLATGATGVKQARSERLKQLHYYNISLSKYTDYGN